MDLSDIDRSQFARIRNKRTKKWYLRMDYEVRISFDYPRLTYEIIIPRNGKFPSAEAWGDNPIRKPAFLNCAAAIELTKPEALETLVPLRRRILPHTPGRDFAGMVGSTRSHLNPIQDSPRQNRVDSSALQKSCRRCRKAKVKCIRRVFGRPCYKCITAGAECTDKS